MKAKFLKIAGVKNEEQFYKKYPTEAAFFKAHPDAKKQIKKAQTGFDFSKFSSEMGGPRGMASSATDIISGIQQIGEQRDAVRRAKQSVKVSDVAAQAAATRPEIPTRKYVRPEDMLTNPNERFMSYGTGTSILSAEEGAQIGGTPTEIQNMYNPGDLYSDLGFEPLMESDKVKQYKKGGFLKKARTGDVTDTTSTTTTLDASMSAVGQENNEEEEVVIRAKKKPARTSILPPAPIPAPKPEAKPIKTVQKPTNPFDFKSFSKKGGVDLVGQFANLIPGVGQDAGSKIGSGVGSALGTAVGGPIGGMVGKFAGKVIGGLVDRSDEKIEEYNEQMNRNIENIALQQGAQSLQGQFSGFVRNGGNIPVGEDGWVSHDWQPQVITKFGEYDLKDLLKPDATMNTLRTGGNIRQNNVNPEEQFAFGGEMKTHWGGYIDPISYNPYLPGTGETVMFRGQSHDESDGKGRTGIGVSYGDTGNDDYTDYAEYGSKFAEDKVDVEVEKGEPAIETQDVNGEKSMLVYGNLIIPKELSLRRTIGDSALDGKNPIKFKNYVADLSKKEDKANKQIEKSVERIDSIIPLTSFDKLAIGTEEIKIAAKNMELKQSAVYKQNAAALQQAINDSAEELGLDADALAKGKIKAGKIEEGAENGSSIPKAQSGIVAYLNENKQPSSFSARKKLAEQYGIKNYKGTATQNQQLLEMVKKGEPVTEEGLSPLGDELVLAANKSLAKPITTEEFMEKIIPKRKETPSAIIPYTVAYSQKNRERLLNEEVERQRKLEEEKEQRLNDALSFGKILSSQLTPFINRPYQEELDPSQTLGELTALATNQLQPVQVQSYQPEMVVPMGRISLQDQLNANQADFNALQRTVGYDPAALSTLAASKYAANQKTLGDQFRLNQELQNQVFNKNRDLLNDARLKNLQLYDQQYQRQEQARSNTKAVFQEAMNSIASKTLQNKLENKTLATYANLFPQYGFDRSMRATQRGLTFFDLPEIEGMKKVVGPDGKPTYEKVETSSTPSTTSNTTTNPVTNTPIGHKSSEQKHGGKTKKSFTNSSILKMYKG